MCGSFHVDLKDSPLGNTIDKKAQELRLSFKEGDIFPKSLVLCVVPKEKGVSLVSERWGLPLGKGILINARIESLYEKELYRNMNENRCALPCSYFYEWKEKKRYSFKDEKAELFFLAGIRNEKGEVLVLTGPSSHELSKIHDRSPLTMNREEMLDYLIKGRMPSLHNERLLLI